MFLRKINYLWVLNLILFVGVVVLGIEQAGKGAEISRLETQIENGIVFKRDLAEEIFKNESDTKITSNIETLGFIKPSNVYYFKTENVFASLPVR